MSASSREPTQRDLARERTASMSASNQIALVTGASRGLGKAIALALADAGFDLILSARTVQPGETRDNSLSVHRQDSRPLPGSLSETAHLAEQRGARVLVVPMDLTDRASVGAGAERVLQEWGRADVLIHNGRHLGAGMMDVFLDTPLEAYGKFFEAHCIAPIILTRALLPGMLERGYGQVVTITSSAAYEAPPAAAGHGGWGLGYAVGKAAGHPLAGVLHTEFGPAGIQAFNVQPGFVATERSTAVADDFHLDVSQAAQPPMIGAVVRWLLTDPGAQRFAGTTVQAQDLYRELGLSDLSDEASLAGQSSEDS